MARGALRRSDARPDFPCVKVKQGSIFETDTRIVRLPMYLDRLTEVMNFVALPGRGLTAAEVQKATGSLRSKCCSLLKSLANHQLINDPVDQGSGRVCRAQLSGGDPQRIHKVYQDAPKGRIRTGCPTALSRVRSGHLDRCVKRSRASVDRPYRRIVQCRHSRSSAPIQGGLPQRDWGGTATRRSQDQRDKAKTNHHVTI